MVNDYEDFMRSLDRGGGRRFGTPSSRDFEDTDDTGGELAALVSAIQSLIESNSNMKSDMIAAVNEGISNISVTGTITTGNVMLNTGALVGSLAPKLNLNLGRNIRRNG